MRPERWRPEPTAQVQLRGVERVAVAGRHGPDDRVVGLVGLEDRPAGPLTAPGPPDRLAEELVRPLRGAFVGQVQRDVG